MNSKASAWDKRWANHVDYNQVVGKRWIPVNRPCDICGEVVKLGFVHPDCEKHEIKKKSL